jgi:hypothetical protein
MRWIQSASTVVEMITRVLLLIILVVVGTVLVVGFVRLKADSKNITVASFIDTSADPREDKKDTLRGLGHDLADALESEILRIAQLHTLTNPWGTPQELPALKMTGPQSIERVQGTISIGGVELPVDVVVEILKPLLARPRTQYVITGNVQRVVSSDGARMQESGNMKEQDACLRLPSGHGTPVHMIIRLEADGRMLKRWSCLSLLTGAADSRAETRSPLEQHLRKIAYDIMWIVLEGVEAHSFESFKTFIEGVEAFRKYKDLVHISKRQTGELSQEVKAEKQKVFCDAEEFLRKAIGENRAYARAYFYLGNLYSWRAYDEEEDEDAANRYEKYAKDMYTQTARGTTDKPREAGALSQFGMGLVDYRHYRKAKQHNKHLASVHLLNSSYEAFTASWKHDPEFYLARTGNALVYAEKADLLTDQKDKKEREGFLNHAIKEFQYAKAIAADRKDSDSLKWLGQQIRELESKKLQGLDTQENPLSLANRK